MYLNHGLVVFIGATTLSSSILGLDLQFLVLKLYTFHYKQLLSAGI